MNVLIIATNRNKFPMAVMPYGACIVAEAAADAGHQVRLLDLMFARHPVRELERALQAGPWDAVGFSVRNIDNNDLRHPVPFFEELLPLLAAVRSRTKATVVLGGAALGVMPESFLRYCGADYAVPAQGKTVFPQFLGALAGGRDPRTVPGMAWIEGGRYRTSGVPAPADVLECAAPEFSRWLNLRAYFSHIASAPLQTKQGCPFNCVYCTYTMSEGRIYRLAHPRSVVAAVQRMAAAGIGDIEIVDNVFNAPYGHALAVCAALRDARTGARFQTVELNPQFLDDRLLDAMEGAGFTGIGVTPESASDRVLKGLGKSYTSDHVRRAAAAVARHRLPTIWMFMLGGPGETAATVRQTLAFAAEHVRPRDTAFFNVGVRIYPGTALEAIARRDGVLRLPREEMFHPVAYVSPAVDAGYITAEVHGAMEKHLNFIDSDSLDFKFLPLLARAGSLAGVRPPLWRHIAALRRGFRLMGMNV